MFLAWCFEWTDYLFDDLDHVSRLPIAMDGSCNGLQNFAAMLRCPETARAVNLAPSEKPNDIYEQVRGRVEVRVRELTEGDPRDVEELAHVCYQRSILEFEGELDPKIKRNIPVRNHEKATQEHRKETERLWYVCCARWALPLLTRKLVKRPVMTYAYAVTIMGIKDQLMLELKHVYREGQYPPEHRAKICDMLKSIIFEEVSATVIAAASAMKWLKAAAKIAAKNNLPVKWINPIGMPILQNYWESEATRIETTIGGMRLISHIYTPNTQAVKKSKQASGIAPNFVHSCDASHLMFTVLASRDAGVPAFHMIHDSYGTHARHAGKLARILREQFVKMYSGNVLADFQRQLQAHLDSAGFTGDANRIPDPPKQGNFDLNLVLNSQYFFA
jgi:DNA-directed RNA polymerase